MLIGSMFRSRHHIKIIVLTSGDCFMIVLALLCSRYFFFNNFVDALGRFPLFVIAITFIYMLCFYIFNLYEDYQRFNKAYFYSRFVIAALIGACITSVSPYLWADFKFKYNLIGYDFLCILVSVPIWRFIFDNFLMPAFGRKRGVIVGAGHSGRYIGDVLKDKSDFEIVGFIDDDTTKHGHLIHGIKVLGSTDLLKALAKEAQIDFVVVAITHEKTPALLDALFFVKMHHVEINDVAYVYEKVMGKIALSHLRDGWIVFSKFSSLSNRWFVSGKRYSDIFLSAIGFIVFLPVMFLVAIAIKIDSRGPVIYKQLRVGQNGRQFLMYKFRSMYLDSETNGGSIYTSINDCRITRTGKFIRKVRFDELPQIWNVLRGDMSIVGPRPEAVELARKYEQELPYYSLRYVVKPGLTGWAQVRYSYSASMETALEKFKYDMFYLKNMSIFLDIQIILKTISVVVFRDFSR